MNVVAIYLHNKLMNANETTEILTTLFKEELSHDRERHLVFWYDEAEDFKEEINQLDLENVRIWKFSNHNLFATKYELEINDPTSHFLLYTNEPKPLAHENWLMNLTKLGTEFTADRITITMRRLGLEDDHLRHVFTNYSQFFQNKKRLEAFESYTTDVYTEENIDITILSVLTRSKFNTMDDIIKSLFRHEQVQDYNAWEQIKKFGNEEKFWLLVEKHYGYTGEKSLITLLTFFMMTYTTEQNVDIAYPKTWTEHTGNRSANIIILMNQWMNHQQDRIVYNEWAHQIEEKSKIDMHIQEWDIHEIASFDAFSVFDNRIIAYILKQLLNDVGHYEQYQSLILERRKTHWYPECKSIYKALNIAISFFSTTSELDGFIPEETATKTFQSYVDTYYEIDMAYRQFYAIYDDFSSKEAFRPLREKIENTYTNWFIQELSEKWANALKRQSEGEWFLPHIPKQQRFYKDWVEPYVHKEQRVFVIISDALRYEIAKELVHQLNNERKASTEIHAMQGVLPSFTALGMASLLPHQHLELSKDGDIWCDGYRTKGTKNREQILQQTVPNSIAITYKELSSMDRTALRQTCAGQRVVYIYHNVVDAIGDNPASETEVFLGVEEAMKDIRTLINRLVNNMSVSNILITADHGFIYQRDKVQQAQLIPRTNHRAIMATRRFMITDEPVKMDGTFTYSLDTIMGSQEKRYVTIPKGVDRFQVQGAGTNYVHGGAMLQEIVLPVITFKNDRSKSDDNVIRQVDVKLSSPTRNIPTASFMLEFFQTVAVQDKILPRYLYMYFENEQGEEISNICRIIADSAANEAAERTFKERFILKSIPYHRSETYYLVLKDMDGTLYVYYPFTIDMLYEH